MARFQVLRWMRAPLDWSIDISTISSTTMCGGRVTAYRIARPRRRPTAARPLVDRLRLFRVAVEAHERELGLDEARVDRRDADVAAEQVLAQRAGEAAHGELRGDVGRAVRVRPAAGDRAEVDDVPGLASERCSTSRVMRTRPLTLVSKTVRSSSSVDSVNGSRPSAEARGVDEDVHRAGGVDEPLAALGVGDVELSATSVSSRSTRRAPPTTFAPSSASMRAVAAPMPLEAPVTIAVLPSSGPSPGTLPPRRGRALRDRQRDGALRDLAVLVADRGVQHVAVALLRLELGRNDTVWSAAIVPTGCPTATLFLPSSTS